jgi:hypothetical protein
MNKSRIIFPVLAPNGYFYCMNKCLMLVLLAGLLFSCKSKKTSLAGNDEQVDTHDFVGFFQPLKLPYEVGDTLLRRKEAETSLIDGTLFSRFVPDSVLTRYFNKELRIKLYAIGKVSVPDHETYLFVKASAPGRKALFILCFDKKDNFAAARPVLYSDNEFNSTGLASLDAKYTLTVTHQRKGPDGEILYKKDAYVFNDAGVFTLIMTESNEAATRTPPIYNPIDTASHKHKYTGDYSQDKRNIISVRDGKDPSRILFFVHFEKDNGDCKGELKGVARFISPTVARYTSNGDPCMIEFTFSPTGVAMKELGGCGNHRDIKCFFEGEFMKRKDTHSKPVKKGHNPGT